MEFDTKEIKGKSISHVDNTDNNNNNNRKIENIVIYIQIKKKKCIRPIQFLVSITISNV